jgi:hypothetical protein
MTNQELILRSEAVAPNAAPGPLANARHEAFAVAVASGATLDAAYVEAGYSRANANALAYRVKQRPEVRRRINELLQGQAANVDRVAHLLMLDSIATADATELTYVVREPCPSCWPDIALAGAMGRAVAARAAMPDTNDARSDCAACSGSGTTRAVIRPTSEWSPQARALFESASTDRYGVTTVKIKDQAKYAAMLAERMPGWIAPERTISANVNVNVPLPDNITPEAALAFLATLKPS